MIKTKYDFISKKLCENYLNELIGRLYKILPMKEENSSTVEVYTESLISELTGGRGVLTEIGNDWQYLGIINSLEFIKECRNTAVCKREIFKCIRWVNNLKQKYLR